MTEVNNGSASLLPAYNTIERTFMVANYGANGGCVDNDDGSSWSVSCVGWCSLAHTVPRQSASCSPC